MIRIFDITSSRLKKESIYILDIGGGDGKRLNLLLGLLTEERIKTESTLVEPSKAFIDNLQLEKNKKVRVINKRWEETELKDKFDLIILIHSIFTFKDLSYLKKIKKVMKKDCLLLIVGNDEKSFLAKLKKETDQKFKGKRKEINSVIRELKRAGFNLEIIKSETNFKNVLDKDKNLNNNGKLIAGWIAMNNYDSLTDESKGRIKKIFKDSFKNYITETEVFVLARLN